MFPRKPTLWMRYVFAIAVVAVATLARFALEPVLDLKAPFTLYFLGVVLSAWFGGFGPGLLATALAGVAGWYFFVPPQYSFRSSDSTAPAQLVVFIVVGILTSLLAEGLHAAKRKAQENERKEREGRERFGVTLASIGDAVIATDASGSVSFINDVAQALTGWTAADALGQPLERVFKIVSEQTREEVENPALRAMKEGRI